MTSPTFIETRKINLPVGNVIDVKHTNKLMEEVHKIAQLNMINDMASEMRDIINCIDPQKNELFGTSTLTSANLTFNANPFAVGSFVGDASI